MEIDTALSEIESKYDFTFNEKQLTAIKSVIENMDTIKNIQFNTKVNNKLLRLNPNNPIVILRFAILTPGRLSR
jgi:uncharacterized protein YpuA (DUF1002 family)